MTKFKFRITDETTIDDAEKALYESMHSVNYTMREKLF